MGVYETLFDGAKKIATLGFPEEQLQMLKEWAFAERQRLLGRRVGLDAEYDDYSVEYDVAQTSIRAQIQLLEYALNLRGDEQ